MSGRDCEFSHAHIDVNNSTFILCSKEKVNR